MLSDSVSPHLRYFSPLFFPSLSCNELHLLTLRYIWLPGLPPSVLPQRMREYSLCEAISRSWPLPSPLSVFSALSRKKSGAKKKRREVSTETFSSVANASDASDASDASGCSLDRSCRLCVVRRVRC